MKINKKGNISSGTIEKYVVIFLMVVVLFKVVATLIPEAMDAGDEINDTNAPLGTLFASNGVVWILVMAGLLILLVKSFMKTK